MSSKRDESKRPEQLKLFENGSKNIDSWKTNKTKKLSIDCGIPQDREQNSLYIEGIPSLTLPTRWENLVPKIKTDDVSIKQIIRPVPKAENVVREIIEYLKTTGGCQVLVMQADTGSGKTTFLNTLPHYMKDIRFDIKTIDLQNIDEEEFGKRLWTIKTSEKAINLIILEGREKPESISDKYIQIVLSHINRFARTKSVPLLFVVPTIETQVARNWCNHGVQVGDLIPEQKLYEGSRWYTFSGVPNHQFIEIAEETVRILNKSRSLNDYGVSPEEIKNWSKISPTIGRFIEILAAEIIKRRTASKLPQRGPREHVWVVYCCPDLRHYDHTWLILNGLVSDGFMKMSPAKLLPNYSDTTMAAHWRQPDQWKKLIATINFLDMRLINLPIVSVVATALAYGSEQLISSFKKAKLSDYKDEIPDELKGSITDWNQPLLERRLQKQNAKDSLQRSNVYRLIRSSCAEPQKGGLQEPYRTFVQFQHLVKNTHEQERHFYLGQTFKDLFESEKIKGFIGVETETPLLKNEPSPTPDITIRTESNTYALEFHFRSKQIAASEVARYALQNVAKKYMEGLSHIRSQLEAMDK